MSALLDTYRIAGWYLLIVALLPALGVGAWMGEALNLERQRPRQARQERTYETARARAAEHPHRTRLHTGHRVIDQTVTGRAPLPAEDMPAWLDAWDREVAGLPWGSAFNFAPVDVSTHVDEYGAIVGHINPVRPSTAMIRRIVEAAA